MGVSKGIEVSGGYTRMEKTLKKWNKPGHNIETDTPDEILTAVFFYDPWGNEVTNLTLLEELEAKYQRMLKEDYPIS